VIAFLVEIPPPPPPPPTIVGGGEGGVDPHPSPREHAQKLEAFLESRTPAGEALRTLHLAMAAEDDDGLTVDLARAVTHPTSPPTPATLSPVGRHALVALCLCFVVLSYSIDHHFFFGGLKSFWKNKFQRGLVLGWGTTSQ